MKEILKTHTTLPIDDRSALVELLNLSHELRTPTHAILGHVELMQSGGMGPLSCDMRVGLGDIRKAGQDLLRQIDRTLQLGEALPCAGNGSPSVEKLFTRMIDLALVTGNERHHTVTDMRTDADQTEWITYRACLRAIASLLNHLEAKEQGDSFQEDPAIMSLIASEKARRLAVMSLEYPQARETDAAIAASMIDAALGIIQGRLLLRPGRLCLMWPGLEMDDHIPA